MALCAAAALLIGPALALPGAADAAGSYTVWSCRGPDGQPVSARAWQSGGSSIATMSDTCASGGDLAVVAAGRSGGYLDDAGARFQSFGGSAIVGYRIWRWTITGGSGTAGAGFYSDVLEDDFGFASVGVDSCRAPGCTGRGNARDPLGAASLVQRSSTRLHSVSIAAGCSAPIDPPGTCIDGRGVNAAFHLQRAAIEISDAVAPALVGQPSAPLLDGGDAVGGPQTIALTADDDGAGVASVSATVDGAPAGTTTTGGACHEPYSRPGPCPSSATLALTLDTNRFPDGEHTLQLTLRDGAGNETVLPSSTIALDNTPPVVDPPGGGGDDRPPVVVPPVPPVVLPPAPPVVVVQPPAPPAVRGDYVLTIGRRSVAAGSRADLSGRVRERGGAAEPDASLVVERRLYGPFGGDWTELRTLRADGAGRFRFPVPARAQQLRVRLLPARAANTTFVSPSVDVLTKLSLRVAPRPRALRNGQTLTLSGAIVNAGESARGKEALVQAIVGDHWQTLDRIRAERNGSFSWRYRFQRTHSEALYSFRVVIAADDERWPWPAMTSRLLRVRVRP